MNKIILPCTPEQRSVRNAGYTIHGPCPADPLDKTASYAWCLDGDYSDEFTTVELAWADAISHHKNHKKEQS